MGAIIDDKAVVGRLLDELVLRLNGAIDTWTTACLSRLLPNFPAFVDTQCRILRSLVTVARTLLKREADQQPLRQDLDNLDSGCDRLYQLFLLLHGHRGEATSEVRDAAQELATIHAGLLEAIRNMGRAIGQAVTPLEEQSEDQKQYYERLLRQLPELFQQPVS